MTEPTIIERLADWTHELDCDAIPERVKEKARLQLISTIAAVHASSRHEIGKAVLEAVSDWSGDGPSTIIPSGKKTDVLSAAYANAALSLALDFDDYLLFGHTGHSAVFSTLAVAEWADRSMKDQLTAQVIANEIEGRLGASVVVGPHNGQAWSHIHLLGSAAASAKLLGLSAEQTAHAMAISLYQPTYVLFPGFMGPDSKATTAANPSIIGIQAAFLAGKGATGPLDILEHPQGFLARFSYHPTPFFFSGLGKAWVTDTLAYKIYPGCAYIDTTVDATLALRERFEEEKGRPLEPDDIKEVLVEAAILTIEMDHLSKIGGSFDPLNPVSINFSIPGNVAIAILKGRLEADDLSREELNRNADQIIALSDKVKLVHDWSLTTSFIRSIDEVLKIREMRGEMNIKELIGARFKMRDQYNSSIDLSMGDFRDLWRQAPEVRQRLWSGLAKGVGNALKSRKKRGAAGYDLGACKLDEFTMPFAARVTITSKDGATFTHLQEIPWGGPGHPLDKTREFVLNKYILEAGKNLGRDKVDQLVDNSDNLEERIGVSKLLDLCCNAR